MTDSHVLVLLDTSPASKAALESAARLARHAQLELIALFVEDQDLIASAGHAFTREVSLLSGQARPFDRDILLARLTRQREQIEAQLTLFGQQEQLQWRLDVITGPVAESIRQAALGASWVVLGKAGWSATRGGRLGSTARRLVETTRNRLLLWEEHVVASQAPVVALVSDLSGADAVLETAEQLALATDRRLQLLLLPGIDAASLPHLARWKERDRPPIAIERLAGHGIEALRRALQKRPAGALVIDESGALALGLTMSELIARLDTPIIRIPAPA